jgi:hypothetical protein
MPRRGPVLPLTGSPPGRHFPRRFHRHLSLSSPFITEICFALRAAYPASDANAAILLGVVPPKSRRVR